jgi:hypothetical protein
MAIYKGMKKIASVKLNRLDCGNILWLERRRGQQRIWATSTRVWRRVINRSNLDLPSCAGAKPFTEEIRVVQSCFGLHCKGKRDRDIAEKIPVLSFLKQGGKVYGFLLPTLTPEPCSTY